MLTAICSEISYKTVQYYCKGYLWRLKDNYHKEYGSLQNYIKDIKECNSLSSDSINAGCSIIVPVYVREHCRSELVQSSCPTF